MRNLLFVLLLLLVSCQTSSHYPAIESSEEHEERMEWWREARFGMFIHWGLYAVPAGEWGESRNHAEWIRTTAQIPLETYDQFIDKFNPEKFDPQAWVRIAKDAGMKYIVITSKHHDGFCLWDSKYTDFDIASTPYEKDLLNQLAKACKDEDIKLCFYHSIMDWHHPDYLPRRGWEKDRSSEGADFDRYVTYMKRQLKELLTNYGDIGVLWFDGEWENTWTQEYGQDLYQYIRSLQPNIIVNNRVSVGRSGMGGITKEGEFGGDFGTPEQQIPATGLPGLDWETCMTMNGHWGYNRFDKDFKSSTELIQKLADIASKGGNFLLNVGPKEDGTFPSESIDRLRDMGRWMDDNSEAIYNTKASPFKDLAWGCCTQKDMAESTRLYLHVFDWPSDGLLKVPGIYNNPIRAFVLSDEDEDELKTEKVDGALVIKLPKEQANMHNSVVVVDIEGKPRVYYPPVLDVKFKSFVDQTIIDFQKPVSPSIIRYTLDGSTPDMNSMELTKPISLYESTTVSAGIFLDNILVCSPSEHRFTKKLPVASKKQINPKLGLSFEHYIGKWKKVPDFDILEVSQEGISTDFEIANNADDEEFGIRYSGYIQIPKSEAYKIFLTADDGALLWINGKLLIDNDGMHAAIEKSAEIVLEKGFHEIVIEYFESSGGNALNLAWESQSMSKQSIDGNYFFH